MELVQSNYQRNYGYHERRQAIAIADYVQQIQPEIDYQQLAAALEATKEPIQEVHNLSFAEQMWGRYFYATRQSAQLVSVTHQALRTTTQKLWILLFDQSSGEPQLSESKPKIVGCVGANSLESNGNNWNYNYGRGLIFEAGILGCISISPFKYLPPEKCELSIAVKFYGVPSSNAVYDLAPV